MIETYVDFVSSACSKEAIELANEQIKRMSFSNWMVMQCQHSQSECEYFYHIVYQRAKEEIIQKPEEPTAPEEEVIKTPEEEIENEKN